MCDMILQNSMDSLTWKIELWIFSVVSLSKATMRVLARGFSAYREEKYYIKRITNITTIYHGGIHHIKTYILSNRSPHLY